MFRVHHQHQRTDQFERGCVFLKRVALLRNVLDAPETSDLNGMPVLHHPLLSIDADSEGVVGVRRDGVAVQQPRHDLDRLKGRVCFFGFLVARRTRYRKLTLHTASVAA